MLMKKVLKRVRRVDVSTVVNCFPLANCDGHWSMKNFRRFFLEKLNQPVSRPRELWLLRETNESGSLYPSPLGLSLLRSSDESRSPSAKSFFTLNDVIDSCNFCCCCCNRALIAWIFGILFASSFVHGFKQNFQKKLFFSFFSIQIEIKILFTVDALEIIYFSIDSSKKYFFSAKSLWRSFFQNFFFSSTLHLRSRSLVWESWWVSLLWQNCSVSSVNDRPFKCWNNCYLHFHKNHLSPCRSLQSIVAQDFFFPIPIRVQWIKISLKCSLITKKFSTKKKLFFFSVQTAHNLHKLIRSRSRQIKNW